MKPGLLFLLVATLPNSSAADNSTRPALTFSKSIGGSGSNIGIATATDRAGNIYLAGTTTSLDFPTVNAYQKRIGGTPFRASADNGKTWTTAGISDPVYAVGGSAAQPAAIYAGTATTLYRSTDSGKSWAALASAGTALFNALWVSTDNPSVVHAATDRGMLRSDDAGATWRAAPTGRGNVLSLAASAAAPVTLFAAMDAGPTPQRSSLYRSTDGGTTWNVLPNAPFGPYSVACDPATSGVLYLATSTTGFTSTGTTALYKSTNSGDSWTQVSDARLVVSTWTVAAAPGVIYLGTRAGLLRSANGGATWLPTPIADSTSVVTVDPVRPQNVYASTDLGIFVSADSGVSWNRVLPVRQLVETVAVAPTVPPTLYVGAAPGRNIFVSKWTPDGSRLLYSTYLGGSYYDYVSGLAVDAQGNAYVTGYAYSNDFPVTPNAAQSAHGGVYDAFVAKLGPDGDRLLYSTYLGGADLDAAFGLAVDSAANVYLTGYTRSTGFPVTTGVVQPRAAETVSCRFNTGAPVAPEPATPPADAFVTKLDTVSGALRYSTFLGGGCFDEGIGIAIDSEGGAYIAGATNSHDFPTTARPLQPDGTAFLAKLSPRGDALRYATYIGGSSGASAFALAVDAKGAAYVTGVSAGFDRERYRPNAFITASPLPAIPQGGFAAFQGGAAFVAKVDPAGAALEYVRYLGGTWGAGTSIALDSSGAAWVAGRAYAAVSTEPFPTLHPFQARTGAGFLSRIASDGNLLFSSMLEAAQGVALDPAGNAFVAASSTTSAVLTRIDAAVPSALTIEEPARLVAPSYSLPAGGVAPGQIVSIPGSGLGPELEAAAQFGAAGALPTTLAGTSVIFGDLPAPLLSVRADRILCVVPFGIPLAQRTTVVQARTAAGASNPIVFPVSSSAIQVLAGVNADGSVNSREHAAAPGSIVTLYGIGFGATSPPSQDGRLNGAGSASFAGTIEVRVDDRTSDVLYAGPAPGQVAGVSQINFRLPQLAPGSYTAVAGWRPVEYSDRHSIPIWIVQR